MDFQRDEHRLHLIVYRLVWPSKRRKAVFHDVVAEECRRIIEQTCAENGWNIVTLTVHPDHIDMVVHAWPGVSAADVVKRIKRATAHDLRSRHPDLRKLPSLWSRAYFAATVGAPSDETIARYIEGQKGR